MRSSVGFASSASRMNIKNFLIVLTCSVAFWTMSVDISWAQYNISGTVSGLNQSSGSILQLYNNGTQIPPINENGAYTFTSSGSAMYSITVPTPPTGETCTVANYGGRLTQDVHNVWVTCQPTNSSPPASASRWKALVNKAPGVTGTMLLLSDGSVMVNAFGPNNTWFRLSPASDGTYAKGTWTPSSQYPSIPNSNCGHGAFASQVLMDGRVFVAGGEYGGATGTPCIMPGQAGAGVDTEIYDPVQNTWTMADPPINLINANSPTQFLNPNPPPQYNPAICGTQAFLDMTSETLPDGSVLMAPVCPMNCGDTLIFNPKLFDVNTLGSGWSLAGTLANTVNTRVSAQFTCNQQEATWVKLQDGSILTADPPASDGANQTSERYEPSQHAWFRDSPLGFTLYDGFYGWSGDGEEGPAFLLPSGNALFVGGDFYTGTYAPPPKVPHGVPPILVGTWTQGDLWANSPTTGPNGPATGGSALSADDAPGAMMVNGKILLVLNYLAIASWIPTPVFFYEYDPNSGPNQNPFTEVAGPGNAGAPSPWTDCGATRMLDLPDGTVLTASNCDGTQLYVYTPDGSPLPQGQPVISSITANGYNSYHLIGTGLNGISEGASYGDDAQMASNYPIVRLTDASGNVTYARTYNWSSNGVMTGTTLVSTEFALPTSILLAWSQTYSLQVIANGNASKPVLFVAGRKPCVTKEGFRCPSPASP